mmetsp:Transcript_59074/g.95542  ORF Transcript_59074/g.95542 Transcript_59074/m.95542 type:complete len:116 (+) Transcript_59074:117-464(+)
MAGSHSTIRKTQIRHQAESAALKRHIAIGKPDLLLVTLWLNAFSIFPLRGALPSASITMAYKGARAVHLRAMPKWKKSNGMPVDGLISGFKGLDMVLFRRRQRGLRRDKSLSSTG